MSFVHLVIINNLSHKCKKNLRFFKSLHFIEFAVGGIGLGQQFLMRPLLNDAAMVEHQNAVGVANGR